LGTDIYRIYKCAARHSQIGLVGTGIHKHYNFHNSCYLFSTSIYEELQLLASNRKKEKKKAHTVVFTTTGTISKSARGIVEPTAGRYPS
jgi:hypothetical protein